MADVVPTELADMNQPVDTTEVDERTKFFEACNRALTSLSLQQAPPAVSGEQLHALVRESRGG